MTGCRPLGQVYPGPDIVKLAKIIDIRFGCAVAFQAGNCLTDRTAPGRIGPNMTDRARTGLGGGIIGAAILEDHGLILVNMHCRINMLVL